ncbi:MAG: helix-turn-helix domain-containing protein [Patescibacteria group bacterium]
MMTQLVDELTTLGFSERIAQAYVLLAQKGEMTAREVGERFSLARPTAHDVMMSLVHHGLARSKSSGKEKTFIMESPTTIREKFEEQRRICSSRLERFESLLPNLQALSSIGGGLCSAVRYIDIEEDIAAACDEFELLPGDGIQLFSETPQRIASDSSKRMKSIVVLDGVSMTAIEDVRCIPRSVLSVDGEIRVRNDRVLLLSSARNPVAIEIRSQVIADVCRATLELAWHTAGKIEEWSGMKKWEST